MVKISPQWLQPIISYDTHKFKKHSKILCAHFAGPVKFIHALHPNLLT